jgi:hypothetical protein
MSRRKRTRYNPLEESIPETVTSPDVVAEHPVAAIGREIEGAEIAPSVERIERLSPSKMVPDRYQPRRILPAEIRRRFFGGEIDCYQAAKEWLRLAEDDAGWKTQINELLAMGGSFEEHGQIKPITGVWQSTDNGGFIFRIETGERRYWAACLRVAEEDLEEEPLLRVEVVKEPSRHRQVLENRHAQSPSAVGQACEIAALMLEMKGIEPDPTLEDEYEYFRSALSQRAPRGFWPSVEPVMQLSARRMQQLVDILKLPTTLLELADRYRVPERVLREVLVLPEEDWEEALWMAIRQGLTSDDIAQLAELEKATEPRKRADDARRKPERIAFSGIRRFARAAFIVHDEAELMRMLDDVADEVMVQGLADELLPLLKELTQLIEARQSRL